MPQTMLVLFAIILSGQIMLVWQRDGLRSQENLIRIELESQARGVASELFEILENRPFDRNTYAVLPTDLTEETDFGSGRVFPAEISDLDDVHGMEPHRVLRTLTAPDGTEQSLEYWVTAEVVYVTDDGGAELVATGGTRTFYKMVTLSILNPHLQRYFNNDVGLQVSRVFSMRQ